MSRGNTKLIKSHLAKDMKKPTIEIDSSISSLVLPVTWPLSDSNTLLRFFKRISLSSKATCLHLTCHFVKVKQNILCYMFGQAYSYCYTALITENISQRTTLYNHRSMKTGTCYWINSNNWNMMHWNVRVWTSLDNSVAVLRPFSNFIASSRTERRWRRSSRSAVSFATISLRGGISRPSASLITIPFEPFL